MNENKSAFLVYPQLKDRVHLKKYDSYVLVYDFKSSLNDFIHPSQAAFLALCSGAFSTQQLEYLIGKTYGLKPEESTKLVSNYISQSVIFLDLLDKPDLNPSMRYDAKQFFYNVDDQTFGENKDQLIPVPIGININLSFKCNFKCRYCYQKVLHHDNEMLDPKTSLRLIREAADWGVAYVGLTGGEPTLYDGWMVLLEEIIRLKMNPVITTNGVVIGSRPDIAMHLKSIGIKEITLSLDASTPKLHHYITCSNNTFSKVIDAISLLIDSGIRVIVKCVLTRSNMHDIENLIDLVAKLGVSEIGISRCELGATGSDANLMSPLSPEEIEIVSEKVKAKSEQYCGICDIHPPRNLCRWNDHDWYPCGGLYTGLVILPSGKVSVCDKLGEDTPFIYGDVFKNSLKEIWNSSDFKKIRDNASDICIVDPDCVQCSKLKICRTSCFIDSMDASGNYFAKHPLCNGPF